MTSLSNKSKVWLGMMVIYLVWGSTYLAIRFAVQSIPPFVMAASRFLIAGIILYTWRRVSGDKPPTVAEWKGAGILGLFLLLGGNGGVVWAEQRVNSGVTALLIGATPFWMVLIDAIRPAGIKPNRRTIIGLLVGFIGIILLIQSSQQVGEAERIDLLGALVLLAASFAWAAGSIYGRDAVLPRSPLLASSVEMLVGGMGLLVAGTLAGEWGKIDLQSIQATSWTGLVYLIIMGSLVGFSTYTWLLKNAPLSLVSTYAYVNPLIAILLGNLLAQEPLTWRIMFSATIILGAVALINSARFSRPDAK